jgi:hypothetical protein
MGHSVLVYATLYQFSLITVAIEVPFGIILKVLVPAVSDFNKFVNDFVVFVLNILTIPLFCFLFVA